MSRVSRVHEWTQLACAHVHRSASRTPSCPCIVHGICPIVHGTCPIVHGTCPIVHGMCPKS
jgi:hypothetical protein